MTTYSLIQSRPRSDALSLPKWTGFQTQFFDEQLQWDYNEEIDRSVWKYTLVYLGTVAEIDRLEKEFEASGESHVPF